MLRQTMRIAKVEQVVKLRQFANFITDTRIFRAGGPHDLGTSLLRLAGSITVPLGPQ